MSKQANNDLPPYAAQVLRHLATSGPDWIFEDAFAELDYEGAAVDADAGERCRSRIEAGRRMVYAKATPLGRRMLKGLGRKS